MWICLTPVVARYVTELTSKKAVGFIGTTWQIEKTALFAET